MDDETRTAFADMMARMNDGFERVLDQVSAMRRDVELVHGHVLFGLQNNLTLSQRITKLEDEIRKRKE
jgi:hypothetical protein